MMRKTACIILLNVLFGMMISSNPSFAITKTHISSASNPRIPTPNYAVKLINNIPNLQTWFTDKSNSNTDSKFGIYSMMPIDDTLYVSLSSSQPLGGQGSMVVKYEDRFAISKPYEELIPLPSSISDGVGNILPNGTLPEKGIIGMENIDGDLYVAGARPNYSYAPDSTHIYEYTLGESLRMKTEWNSALNGSSSIFSMSYFTLPGESTPSVLIAGNYCGTNRQCNEQGNVQEYMRSYKSRPDGTLVPYHFDYLLPGFPPPPNGENISRMYSISIFNNFEYTSIAMRSNSSLRMAINDIAGWIDGYYFNRAFARAKPIQFNDKLLVLAFGDSMRPTELIQYGTQYASWAEADYALPFIVGVDYLSQGMPWYSDYNLFATDNNGYLYTITSTGDIVRTKDLQSWETVGRTGAALGSIVYWPARNSIVVGGIGENANIWGIDLNRI